MAIFTDLHLKKHTLYLPIEQPLAKHQPHKSTISTMIVTYYRRVGHDMYCYMAPPLYESTTYHPSSFVYRLFRRRHRLKGTSAVVFSPISIAIDVALSFLHPLLQSNWCIQQ